MIEKEFEQLLRQYQDSLGNRSRFFGLVRDFFPGKQRQINLLLSAFDLGIAKEIESVKTINNAFAYRFVKRLVDEYGISRANADWVVSVWCVCYGQNLLHKPCDIKLRSESDAAPAIREEKATGNQYGDLFCYESGRDGLAVAGFSGENNKMIILLNTYRSRPVTGIKAGAFSESSVEEAIFSEGIRTVGARAFYGCRLKQVVLPSSLREIGEYAFAGNGSLKSVALPSALERLGDYAFSGTGLKTLQIPKTVYWLGNGVFSQCNELESIEIPESLDRVTDDLFLGCSSLKKVKLHECLNSIGTRAFSGCGKLMSIYIPDSVTAIGEDAFADCNEKFILMCSFGSYAEGYARKNKITYQLV